MDRTVLRGMEFYRGRLIAYSLGNFATYRGFNLGGPLGVTGVLQLEFSGDRTLRAARLIPMKQLPGEGPAPDPDSTAIPSGTSAVGARLRSYRCGDKPSRARSSRPAM